MGLRQGQLLPKLPKNGQRVEAEDRMYFPGIRQEEFTLVFGNFLTHLDVVIETNGGHIETVLH